MSDPLHTARLALAGGRLDDAVRLCRQAAGSAPGADVHLIWATALWKQGHREEALRHLDGASERHRDAGLYHLHGMLLVEADRHDEAASVLERAAELAPRDVRIRALLGRVYIHQRRDDEAVDVIQGALAIDRTDVDVLVAFGRLGAHLGEPAAVEMATMLLRQVGGPEQEIVKLGRVLRQLRERETAQAAHSDQPTAAVSVDPRREWDDDEVAIFCGRTRRAWSPQTLGNGVGGSEEAVIRLSRELVRLGWRVTVFNCCGDEAGVYDGVTYRPFEAFNREDRFNVLVGWRNVRLFDTCFDAALTCLWLHDLPEPQTFTRRRLENVDRILVLSDFHRGTLPHVADEQFLVTGNGIDPDAFDAVAAHAAERVPTRCLYASSYDRGLEVLLDVWGDVRRAVPEAELAVCYGWEAFGPRLHDSAFQPWKARMDRLMAQDGVVHLGRVSQERVLEETFRSGVLAYPATFAETSCITAMKAQAGGAVPVVFGYAALDETVQFGHKLPALPDGRCVPAQRAAYRDALVAALSDAAWQEDVRREMMPWARHRFAWSTVARDWDLCFNQGTMGGPAATSPRIAVS